MTDLLEEAITKIKQLPESQQDEYAKMILDKLESKSKLTILWEKVDELGEDTEKVSMEEITAMVKQVRHQMSES